ncbi:MAG: type II toxin-antitoxin system PemK/MazF family toxin [Bacteroidales bacterium]|nr:type II toxin-antitoxin system PemK/MazF family toxin [Bacteroidales bacterium]
MNCEQRQIFKAPVQFSDKTGTKFRPILVLSNNKHNKLNDDLICCPITSKNGFHGRMISPKDYEIEGTTLPVRESEVKSQHPFFIHKSSLVLPQNGRIKLKKDFTDKIITDIKDLIEKK